MKKTILFLSLVLLFSATAEAETKCFLAKENNQIINSEGSDCETRYAPESTFKIALSMMGFDSGVLQDETNPSFPCKEEYDYFINTCKGPHTPSTWMRDSCLWYSRVLTQELKMEKFQDYIQKFNYGNKEIKGKNALIDAWISSSLQISPLEQTEFLQKVADQQFPISSKAYKMTKKIMFLQELPGGWKLYGKTGNGRQLDKDSKKTDLQHGWFVGFIEKDGRSITFASHIKDDKKYNIFASFRARNEALIKLWYLIDELEK